VSTDLLDIDDGRLTGHTCLVCGHAINRKANLCWIGSMSPQGLGGSIQVAAHISCVQGCDSRELARMHQRSAFAAVTGTEDQGWPGN